MYALETFVNLLSFAGTLPGCFELDDGPAYAHRGVLLDVGRRFYPVDLMHAVLDGKIVLEKAEVVENHGVQTVRASMRNNRSDATKLRVIEEV